MTAPATSPGVSAVGDFCACGMLDDGLGFGAHILLSTCTPVGITYGGGISTSASGEVFLGVRHRKLAAIVYPFTEALTTYFFRPISRVGISCQRSLRLQRRPSCSLLHHHVLHIRALHSEVQRSRQARR